MTSGCSVGELQEGTKILEGFVTEECLETCRSLLAFCKCLALWFNCCTTDIDSEYIAH